MILREAVLNFNLDVIWCTAYGLRSVVKDFVRFKLVSCVVLWEESIVDKPIHDLSLANETRPQHTDSLGLGSFIATLAAFRFLSHTYFFSL